MSSPSAGPHPASAEDFHTHLSAPHLVDFVGKADVLVDGPLTITPLRRIA